MEIAQASSGGKKRLILLFFVLLAFLTVDFVFYLKLRQLSFFNFVSIQATQGQIEKHSPEPQFVFYEENSSVKATLIFSLPRFYPQRFQLWADDCIEGIEIGSKTLRGLKFPLCDYPNGRVLDLGEYLHPGRNVIRIQIRNYRNIGGFHLTVARSDWTRLGPRLALLLCLLVQGVFLIRWWAPAMDLRLNAFLFLGGSLLRLFYFFGTDHLVRSHDVGGHLDYISSVAKHWILPRFDQGWEYYQPPLYYYLSAALMKLAALSGVTAEEIPRLMQGFSLLHSLVSLALLLWISQILFPWPSHRYYRLCFAALVSFLPAIIYIAPRINNDALLLNFSFLAVALLLLWWKRPSWPLALALSLSLALGILTKSNMLILLPPCVLLLFLHPELRFREKVKISMLSAIIISAVNAWHVYQRVAVQGQQHLVGNISSLHSGLQVGMEVKHFLVLSPLKVLENPYNDCWKEDSRRSYFWEFFLRSAISGEYDFGKQYHWLVSYLLLLLFQLFPFFVFGLWRSVNDPWQRQMPLLVLLLLVLLTHLAFRALSPFAPSQDFRYSAVVVVPVSYFTVTGASLSSPLWRNIGFFLMVSFIIACIFLELMLYFAPIPFVF